MPGKEESPPTMLIPKTRLPVQVSVRSTYLDSSANSMRFMSDHPHHHNGSSNGLQLVEPAAASRPAARGGKGSNQAMRLAAMLTCLQFSFAIYATFLLYYMSPTVPDLNTPFFFSQFTTSLFGSSSRRGRMGMEILPPPATKSMVCQAEHITFSQKKSNNTVLIDMKTSLFRSVPQNLPSFHVSKSLHLWFGSFTPTKPMLKWFGFTTWQVG